MVEEEKMASKLTYIASMFSRANHKKYENYVVTAIYHKIGNYNLKPVTQQKVISKSDPSKYYLLDLYFPQLNFGIEVDEPAHNNSNYALHDIERAEDILESIECEEKRVKISDNYNIEDVNKQIDDIVEEIVTLINQRGHQLIWDDNEEMLEEAFRRRSFRTAEKISYPGFSELWSRISGEPYKKYQRCYFKNKTITGGYHLWVPSLAMEYNGKRYGDAKWENTLNESGTEITETGYALNSLLAGGIENGERRVVFMKMRDEFGAPTVRFMGVFQHISNPDGSSRKYVKISDEYIF